MIKSSLFSQTIEKYRSKKYYLGDPNKGIDCFTSILGVYADLGIDLPKEFEGLTSETYSGRLKANEKETYETFGRYLLSLGRPVGENFFIRGDLLIFFAEPHFWFPGIALQNGNVFLISEESPCVRPFSAYKKYFIAARRIFT